MAGRADIEAGRAHVTLYTKNSPLTQGLRAGMTSVRGFVGSVASIATAATAAATTILAPIGLALSSFVKVGSELNDMSARTGVAASELQHLRFAAEQTGATLKDVEVALRTMAKKGLGNDIEAVARSINAIPDPAQRATAAIEAFGRSGTRLLPMLADFKNLKASSQALGPILTDEEVRLADELGDKMSALGEALSRAMGQIGAQLGPHLKSILDGAIGMVVKFANSVKDTNEFGRGGDWLDKAAEFLRTPLSEFVATGAAAPGVPHRGGAGGPREPEVSGAKSQWTTAEEIQRGINRAWERRQALIREAETASERFLRKQDEIRLAINEANRNRVMGFIGEEEARAQMFGLRVAMARLQAAEAERRAAEAARLRPALPEKAKEVAKLPDRQELARNVAVGFTATGLLAAAGGSRDATVSELKLLRRELVQANTKLAKMADRQQVARAG